MAYFFSQQRPPYSPTTTPFPTVVLCSLLSWPSQQVLPQTNWLPTHTHTHTHTFSHHFDPDSLPMPSSATSWWRGTTHFRAWYESGMEWLPGWEWVQWVRGDEEESPRELSLGRAVCLLPAILMDIICNTVIGMLVFLAALIVILLHALVCI